MPDLETLAADEAADIIDQINAACVGHPHARIPWPHRLLHGARDEISRLRAEIERLTTAQATFATAQARAMAAEKQEAERLRGELARVRSALWREWVVNGSLSAREAHDRG